MYLLDSNICIYIINQRPLSVVETIKRCQPNQIKLSSISLGELEYGVSKSANRLRNRTALLSFSSCFDIIDFTGEDAEIYGTLRAGLERVGQVIGPYDLQIAAQAISRRLTLVTNNTREFSRIPDLSLQNWL